MGGPIARDDRIGILTRNLTSVMTGVFCSVGDR